MIRSRKDDVSIPMKYILVSVSTYSLVLIYIVLRGPVVPLPPDVMSTHQVRMARYSAWAIDR